MDSRYLWLSKIVPYKKTDFLNLVGLLLNMYLQLGDCIYVKKE